MATAASEYTTVANGNPSSQPKITTKQDGPSNAIDVFVHNGWNSNYGAGYDFSGDWLQVQLAAPAPIHEVFIQWQAPAKPTQYILQVSTDAACATFTDVRTVPTPADKNSQVVNLTDPITCVRMQGVSTTSTTGHRINELELWSGPKPAPVVGQIIPVPVQQTPGTGANWNLTRTSRLVISDAALAGATDVLAGPLRVSTGFALPVVTGTATAADIALTLGAVADLPAGNATAAAEGYSLTVSAAGVSIVAPAAHGVFNGFQSLRQLLPAASYSKIAMIGPWPAAPITVVDYPRYAHRGLQLDPARNFLTVDEVKSMIDQVAELKGSRLHLHLSDSQSWRLQINGYPALDGRGCNGNQTACKAADIIGVEAPISGESVPGLPNNQYMVFPRLAGIFEIAWSPKTLTQDINAYIQRVSAAGPRFAFAEVNYGSITQITWQKSAMGAYAYLDADNALDATVLARMTAASEKISEYTATISWGDGSASEPGTITGKEYAANLRQGRTAMTVAGTHTYPRDGVYMGSVTFTRAGVSTVVPFIAQANPADVPPQSDAQVITASLSGNPLRLSIDDPSPIALGAATLTGHDQIVSGTLHPATVLDPRGSNAGWSLTGQVSDFAGSGGGIILAANLGWEPNAQSVGGSLNLAPAGLASVVDPGPDLVPGNGLGTPSTLCSAAPGASAGAFHCGADLQFGIPYNANLGTYTGVLTLTLI